MKVLYSCVKESYYFPPYLKFESKIILSPRAFFLRLRFYWTNQAKYVKMRDS